MGKKIESDRQYYFMYNNNRIECGTILKFKLIPNFDKTYFGEEVTFLWYNSKEDVYWIMYSSFRGVNTRGIMGDNFKKFLIEPTNKVNQYVIEQHEKVEENRKLTFSKELKLDGMAYAWIWYIFLMGITTIFVGNIYYWIVISVIFFSYRERKIKEGGYK